MWRMLSVLLLCLATVDQAIGMPIAEFRERYTAAAARIEEAYSRVRIRCTETRRNDAGDVLLVSSNEYIRNADLIRGVITIQRSSEASAGTIKAFGGSAMSFFEIHKSSESEAFIIDSFRSTSNYDPIVRHLARPVFAPYCIYDVRIIDYLNKPEVKVLSTETSSLDEKAAISVETEWLVEPSKLIKYKFYFEPEELTLLGWTLDPRQGNPSAEITHHRLSYDSDTNPPKLRKLEFWGQRPQDTNRGVGGTIYEISELTFVSISDDEFTLAALGVEGPAGATGRRSSYSWIIALNAVVFGALGVWFAILSVRRRKRADTKPMEART